IILFEAKSHLKLLITLLSPCLILLTILSPRVSNASDLSSRNVIPAMTLESRSIDICCISETCIQDPSTVIRLTSPCENKESARFTLRVSVDLTSTTRGLAGVGIALILKAEQALLDWIPTDRQKSSCDNYRGISLTNIVSKILALIILRRLTKAHEEQTRENQGGFRPGRDCIDQIFTFRQVLEHSHTFRRPTIAVLLDLKFNSKLTDLLQKARRSDIVIMAGDLNAQVGRLSENERHLGGCYGVTAQRTDNGDRLLQLCSDNGLFLANTNFRHKEKHLLTWRPPKSSQQDCRSFWGTCLDSDHALVRARICLRLTG
ncbi:Craniofacial development protein, partial [Schistosoma japonicum]